MGNLLGSDNNIQKPKLIMTGLDNAGKTTILYQQKPDKIENLIPRIGFLVEQFKSKQFEIFAWDVGRADRCVYIHIPKDSNYDGLIYVDYADKERMEYAICELQKLLIIDEIKDLPLLLLINKKDPCQVNIQEIALQFSLEKLCKNWHIQPCSALTGDGVKDGLKWMQKQIK
ncbi:unnamed protein product [Paramecium sonneborni]|uniref:ADP-ribosylation factor n=1 Tax=Paramecium sonneborni TaxID=65129 RepID=A0A8S1P9X6_9CILI|nr:unnamed protein product [Paramecium sonneborni]